MSLMATERKKPATEPPTRSFTMNMATALYNVLDRHSRKDRRDKKDIVEMALEEFFEKLGLWPATDASGKGGAA